MEGHSMLTTQTIFNTALVVVFLLSSLAVSPQALAQDAAAPKDPAATVDSLFGRDIQRVQATSSPADNIELAGDLLAAAKQSTTSPSVAGVLCLRVVDLLSKAAGGEDLAIEAIELGLKRDPSSRLELLEMRVPAVQRKLLVSSRDEREKVGEALVEAMVAHADAVVEFNATRAGPLYTRALSMAARLRSDRRDEIIQKRIAARDRVQLDQHIKTLMGKLEAMPTDAQVNAELLTIYLERLDDPQRASRFVEHGGNDDQKRFVPLALKAVNDVPTLELVPLADYYKVLAARPNAKREALLHRSADYYAALLKREAASTLLRTKADLSLKKLREELGLPADGTGTTHAATGQPNTPQIGPDGRRQIPEAIKTWAKTIEAMPAEQQVQAILPKLREVNGGLEIVVSGKRIIDGRLAELDLSGNAELTNIDPLIALDLTELKLENCPKLTDLAALRGMKLTKLYLRNCKSLKNLDDLKGMPLELLWMRDCTGLECDLSALKDAKLEDLGLTGCSGITGDLSHVRHMPIRMIYLTGSGLTSLEGIADLKQLYLRRGLDLSNCKELTGDLLALKGMKLPSLTLTNCAKLESLDGVQGMPLTRLDVSGCKSLSVDLSMLRGAKLQTINMTGVKRVGNLAVLTTMPLSYIYITPQQELTSPQLMVLSKIRTLRRVSTGNRTIDAKIISQIKRR